MPTSTRGDAIRLVTTIICYTKVTTARAFSRRTKNCCSFCYKHRYAMYVQHVLGGVNFGRGSCVGMQL